MSIQMIFGKRSITCHILIEYIVCYFFDKRQIRPFEKKKKIE